MSDDDDGDEADANERTLSRWRARISRGKRIAIIGTRSVEPRFTNPCVVRWTRGASNRMESSRETTHTELNARTEWVKYTYRYLSYTTCTTAGVFIKSRKIIIPQSALRCLFRLKGHREALQGRPTVGLVHPFHALSVSSALLIFFCAAVLLFRSPLFVKR